MQMNPKRARKGETKKLPERKGEENSLDSLDKGEIMPGISQRSIDKTATKLLCKYD